MPVWNGNLLRAGTEVTLIWRKVACFSGLAIYEHGNGGVRDNLHCFTADQSAAKATIGVRAGNDEIATVLDRNIDDGLVRVAVAGVNGDGRFSGGLRLD